MSRVFTIEKSRKSHKCGNCGDTIKVGEPYRWTKPRYGGKKVRCVKPSCKFRQSDLSGAKTAVIYDAIEDAQKVIETAESHEEIQAALQGVAEVARDVGSEYEDANSSWAGGSTSNPEFEEKAEACNSFADELEGWEFSDTYEEEEVRQEAIEEVPAKEEGETDSEYDDRLVELQDQAWQETLQSMRDEAGDALSEFSL